MKSKNSPYPTWHSIDRFARFTRMRWLGLLLICVASVATAAPKASNPAFLGIGMRDQSPSGPCVIDSLTPGGGAQAAGVQVGDMVVQVDASTITTCDQLVESVVSREPSDFIALSLLRNGRVRVVKARLTSRGEIFHNRYAGRAVSGANLVDLDDGRDVDLSALKGRATIVGWFDPRCTSCKALLARVADWVGNHRDKASGLAISRSLGNEDVRTAAGRKRVQSSFAIDLPLAMVDNPDGASTDELLFSDLDRATLMVIDCRGVVAYVAPIAADGTDTDAALDELFAAADQARLPRR